MNSMIFVPMLFYCRKYNQLKIYLTVILITLTGCISNKYSSNYSNANLHPVDKFILHETSEPKIIYSSDFISSLDEAFEAGYGLLGESAFAQREGNLRSDSARQQIIEQANKIGASLVICREKYLDTLHGNITTSSPVQNTSYHSGNIGGTNYSGTSTSYGTKTTSIPYSVNYSNYQTLFLARLVKGFPSMGLFFRSLTREDKIKYGRNQGVVVTIVVQDSPAWNADILPEDVLVAFDGNNVVDFKSQTDTRMKLDAIQDLIDEDFVWNEKASLIVLRKGKMFRVPIERFLQ